MGTMWHGIIRDGRRSGGFGVAMVISTLLTLLAPRTVLAAVDTCVGDGTDAAICRPPEISDFVFFVEPDGVLSPACQGKSLEPFVSEGDVKAAALDLVVADRLGWIGYDYDYDYDDAHRQVAVYDTSGNRTDYTLDNAGNRIGEQTKDPSGALKRQLSRSIDAFGRVQQTTGRE
ncbi:MAG: hypothetical protein KF754_16060 [Planctomycetes bacterium]|nr:hypothetical protein [Planctomycetota bacterium]